MCAYELSMSFLRWKYRHASPASIILLITMELATSETVWNEYTSYDLGLFRLITQYLGIWPLTCDNTFSKFRVVFVCVLQLTMIVSMIFETYSNCGAANDKIQTISLISCAAMTIVKVVILSANNNRMLCIILSAMDDWSGVKSLNDNETMKSCAKLGRNICLFQMISSYITAIPIILSGLVSTVVVKTINSSDLSLRGLPLRTECFYGEMSTPLYTAVYILQAIQLLTTSTGNIGCDCYFFGITMHLSGQVERLGHDMEEFGSDVEETEYHMIFVSLIKRQNHLLELAGHLEHTFNIIILIELSAITYQICLVGLQMLLSIRMGSTVIVVNSIIMLTIFYLQLFLYTYAGDRLSSGFENWTLALYKVPWWDMPSNITKDIIFILMRCHQPVTLTAGKICPMNLESFKNIIKAIGSYFSVLVAMFDK